MTREEFAVLLLKECSGKKISHCVLRDYETLPDSVGHDIDLAVSTHDLTKFEECIASLTQQHDLSWVRLDKKNDYRSFAVIINPSLDGILKIDVWNEFRWRGMIWLDIGKVLSCVQEQNGFIVASPGYRTLIRIWKDLIFTGKIPDRTKDRVLSEVGQSIDDVNKLASDYLGIKLGCKLVESIKASAWEKTSKLSRSIRWKLLFRHLKKTLGIIDAIIGIFTFSMNFLKKFFYPHGKLVVLVGPDGSGKTTLSDELLKVLPRLLFARGHYVYSRFGILPDLKSIFGSSLTKKCGAGSKVQTGQSLSAMRAVLMTSYYALDYALGRFKIVFWKARGHIIVSDRYYYDYYLQPHWKNTPRFILRLCELIVPRPDLTLFLHCDSKLIYNRKPELDISEITRQQDKAKVLLSRLRPAAQISTGKDVQLAIKATISEILKTLPVSGTKGER